MKGIAGQQAACNRGHRHSYAGRILVLPPEALQRQQQEGQVRNHRPPTDAAAFNDDAPVAGQAQQAAASGAGACADRAVGTAGEARGEWLAGIGKALQRHGPHPPSGATAGRLLAQIGSCCTPALEQASPLMAATEASGEAKMRRRQAFMASHTSLQPAAGGRGGGEHLLSRQQGVHFVSHERRMQLQPQGCSKQAPTVSLLWWSEARRFLASPAQP